MQFLKKQEWKLIWTRNNEIIKLCILFFVQVPWTRREGQKGKGVEFGDIFFGKSLWLKLHVVWAPDRGVMVEAPDVGHHEGSRGHSVALNL